MQRVVLLFELDCFWHSDCQTDWRCKEQQYEQLMYTLVDWIKNLRVGYVILTCVIRLCGMFSFTTRTGQRISDICRFPEMSHAFCSAGWFDWLRLGWLVFVHRFPSESFRRRTWSASTSWILGSRRIHPRRRYWNLQAPTRNWDQTRPCGHVRTQDQTWLNSIEHLQDRGMFQMFSHTG